MRISITGEKKLIESLEAALKNDKAIKTEPPKHVGDRTELSFGIGEISTFVSILTGTAKLVEYLVAIAKHVKDKKGQKLQLKTATGTVTVELRPDVTLEELQALLKGLEPHP